MKRKILAVLMSAAASVSIADVSLYGRVAVGLEQDSFPNTSVADDSNIQDFGSYFGIRGYDQVYGDTSAIWQIEQYLDLTSGQAFNGVTGSGAIFPNQGNTGFSQNGRVWRQVNTLASGESYLGLQGIFGRIRLGNLSNYMRSSMGAVDLYNYSNGVNGLSNYSRINQLLPTTIRYDSPTWLGMSFAAAYSFQSSGLQGVSGINSVNNFSSGLNGSYAGGTYSIGAGWANDNFSIKLGTWIFQNVGSYTTDLSSNFCAQSSACYENAYANRLELGYNDPDGLILGLGFQTTSGFGWSQWATSGGSWNNFVTNQNYNYPGLNSNQYQTQEFGGTIGWHIGQWTPKLGYMYGNNLMYNGNITSVIAGSANSIPNSGYQQAVAELDWNITPRTIVFLNYGQAWYGSTLQNIAYCGNGCGTLTAANPVNSTNQSALNQNSLAIGFSHTF
ncbi:MAG: hypothetical protein K0R49_297 [Burkholderiales bacterium]|jgi:predicted porin|nr:hypothetical protein [Burkholderiales bacterium]MCE3268045.1 hypothetical protein [Burkholderiales bacterium]